MDAKDYSAEIVKFVKQLATATGDLSQLTCPSFLLNGFSLLDYSLHWCDHPQVLMDAADEEMVSVVRWFISTLYGSYHSRCAGSNSEKKPFNPVLGESLSGTWSGAWGDSCMNIEQVSHHPPVSAFALTLPAKHDASKPYISVQGHCGQRTVFTTTGTVKVTQVGRVKLTVHNPGKEAVKYTIFPLPELSVAGLLSGKIFVELLGKTKITSSHGYSAEIEFIPKGWFTGEYFIIKGHIKKYETVTHTLSGNWTSKTMVKKEGDVPVVLFDSTIPPTTALITPYSNPLSSHVLWGPVTEAIKSGDYSTASKLKSEIEDKQRSIRKQRKEDGEVFTPQFFRFEEAVNGDLDGTTALDPQMSGIHTDSSGSTVQGHWIAK